MSKTTFSGPIRTGKDYGIPVQNTIGTVLLVQAATVAVGALKNFVVLPPNSSMVGATVIVRQAVSGVAAGVNVRIGSSADATKYGTVPVSAVRSYDVTAVSGATVVNVGTADYTVIAIDATAQASAAEMTQFDAVTYIRYIQNS